MNGTLIEVKQGDALVVLNTDGLQYVRAELSERPYFAAMPYELRMYWQGRDLVLYFAAAAEMYAVVSEVTA